VNFHESAINIIKNCSTFSHARKELKKYGLTKSEIDAIIKLARKNGKRFL
jgi:hypothetical protein